MLPQHCHLLLSDNVFHNDGQWNQYIIMIMIRVTGCFINEGMPGPLTAHLWDQNLRRKGCGRGSFRNPLGIFGMEVELESAQQLNTESQDQEPVLWWWLLFSHLVVSYSLRPQGLQHTRFSCPSQSPGVSSNSYPLNR